MLKIIAKIMLLLVISGCSTVDITNWAFPYAPTVQQGNYIDNKMVAALHVGMTKQQVLSTMDGAQPVSQFVFDSNIWTYIYQVYKNDDLVESKKVTLEFKNDKVVKITKKLSVS